MDLRNENAFITKDEKNLASKQLTKMTRTEWFS